MTNTQRLLTTVLSVLVCITSFAQADSVLIKAERLNKHAAAIVNLDPWSDSADIISGYNDIITSELPALLADKGILKHNIRDLFGDESGIGVTVSEDGKLRILNWFANTGGSFHMVYEIRQFVDGGNIYVSPVEETVGTGKIYQFSTKGGKFYLVESSGITCNTCNIDMARAFIFAEGELQLCRTCIEDNNGLITIDYRWDDLIHFGYNDNNKIFSIAYITDDLNAGSDEKNHGKTIFEAYKFNGNYFERIPQYGEHLKPEETGEE